METPDGSIGNKSVDEETPKDNHDYVKDLRKRAEEVSKTVDKFEHSLCEVEKFFAKMKSNTRGSSFVLEETNAEKIRQLKAIAREEYATKRMDGLMRKFRVVLHKITKHKWAGPFLKPVDALGLGLTDYFKVIGKPMDFETIENKMKAKDGTGYTHVREICSDVRLVFENAMKYNDETHEIHIMAKQLSAIFEENWIKFLPKVYAEENHRREEFERTQLEMQLAREDLYARRAMELKTELEEFDKHLKKLQEDVLQKCRKFTPQEKADLGRGLAELSVDDVREALWIVCQMNPSFQVTAETVELDLDTIDDVTLWRLMVFVKAAQEPRGKTAAEKSKKQRKRAAGDAQAKSSQKQRSKKLP